MLRGVALLSTIFAFVTLLFPSLIMGMFTNDPQVIKAGVDYFMISIPNYYLLGFSLTTKPCFAKCGESQYSVYSSIAAFFINVFFNWVFIFRKSWRSQAGSEGSGPGDADRPVCLSFVSLWDSSFSKKITSG